MLTNDQQKVWDILADKQKKKDNWQSGQPTYGRGNTYKIDFTRFNSDNKKWYGTY